MVSIGQEEQERYLIDWLGIVDHVKVWNLKITVSWCIMSTKQ